MPFSAPPWLLWHPTLLASPPLMAVHLGLLHVSYINWYSLGLCSRPCCFLPSSPSSSFLSLSLSFSCHPDLSDPQDYASSFDLSSESIESPTGYLHLAQIHRFKTGTGPAPRETCPSSSDFPSLWKLSKSLQTLLSCLSPYSVNDQALIIYQISLGSVYTFLHSHCCYVSSGLSHLSAPSSLVSLPAIHSLHSSPDDLSKHKCDFVTLLF